jgi:hypothetical protein
MGAVRIRFVRRALAVPVAATHETRLDRTLVALTGLTPVLPCGWMVGVLQFADAPGAPWRLARGVRERL